MLTLQSGFDSFGVGNGGDSMVQHDLQMIRTEMIGNFLFYVDVNAHC